MASIKIDGNSYSSDDLLEELKEQVMDCHGENLCYCQKSTMACNQAIFG